MLLLTGFLSSYTKFQQCNGTCLRLLAESNASTTVTPELLRGVKCTHALNLADPHPQIRAEGLHLLLCV